MFLIIGDGVAGHTAATVLRKESKDTEITVLSDEEYPFYDRVGLKTLVEGTGNYKELIKANKDFYRTHNIKLGLESKVNNIDTDNKVVDTDDDTFSYDKLLIAAGGRLRKLDVQGFSMDNVYYLWNMKDGIDVNKKVKKGNSAVVIGGGFLGLEMCCCLRKRGLDVKYLIREGWWGKHCAGEEVGHIVSSILEEKGVDVFNNVEAWKCKTENKRVVEVKADGQVFKCDCVFVCIGLLRNLNFLKGSGINTNKGIVTNEFLETNKEGVFAAGDITEFYNPILRKKMMNGSWPSAKKQGEIAALNMLDKHVPFKFVNIHVVNHFGLNIMTLGDVWLSKDKRIHVDKKKNRCVQVVTKDDRVVGAVLVNAVSNVQAIKKAIKEGKGLNGLME